MTFCFSIIIDVYINFILSCPFANIIGLYLLAYHFSMYYYNVMMTLHEKTMNNALDISLRYRPPVVITIDFHFLIGHMFILANHNGGRLPHQVLRIMTL